MWNWNCVCKIYFCKILGFSEETKVLSHHPSTTLTFRFLKVFFVSGSVNHKSSAQKRGVDLWQLPHSVEVRQHNFFLDSLSACKDMQLQVPDLGEGTCCSWLKL